MFGVSAQEASLGGLLGQVIAGDPGWEAALRTGAPLLAGLVLIYPRTVPSTWFALRWVILQLAALRLPQRGWRLAKAVGT